MDGVLFGISGDGPKSRPNPMPPQSLSILVTATTMLPECLSFSPSGDAAQLILTEESGAMQSTQWRCEACNASFQRPEHYQRHIRTHTKEKPFACVECGQQFSRVYALVYL